jgi:predicted acetyltransferase
MSPRSTRVSYGLADEGGREELARIVALSFGFRVEEAKPWFERAGEENVRVYRRGARVEGGLIQLPMGQHFAGRSVTTVGYAAVGVEPAARARGVATEMMQRAMRELYDAAVPLSSLYPASLPLYRRAGFEVAGGWYRWSARAIDFARSERLAVRDFTAADEPLVRRLYAAQARERNGWLDRSDYIWERVRRERDGAPVHGHLLEGERAIEGYLFYRLHRVEHGFDMEITDMAAVTARAVHALASLIGDHRSIGHRVRWHGGVAEPLIATMREHRYRLELAHHWMLRIVSVAAALEARGYPAGLRASLGLEIRDDVLAGNSGRFRLDVEDGQARVRPGGRGELALDVRALAALYSGFHSAKLLQSCGQAEGGDSALRRADAIFAAPAPSMADQF